MERRTDGSSNIRTRPNHVSFRASHQSTGKRFRFEAISLARANKLVMRLHRHSGPVLVSITMLELFERDSGRSVGAGIML